MIDEETRYVVEHLQQQQSLVCKVITDIVHLLAHGGNANSFCKIFFNGGEYAFDGIGENNIPGGIRSWLDRYFMQSKYKVTFKIEEAEDDFAVDVLIDNNSLEDIMTKHLFGTQKMEISMYRNVLRRLPRRL